MSQTITRLEVSNVKRLRAVTISPQGNLVVIGGENAHGKSSVLDSIAMAIGGKGVIPERPIREGQSKASIILETEDLIVERTFTAADGSTLVVKKKDGSKLASPQSVLDALTSKIAFDPLDFIGLEPKKQAETLRALAGINFTDLDTKRKAAYNERTALNRQVAELEALLKAKPYDSQLPEEETTVTALAAKLQEVSAQQAANDRMREQLGDANDAADEFAEKVVAAEQELKRAQESLARQRQAHLDSIAHRDALKLQVAQLVDPDSAAVAAEVANIELTNKRIRENVVAKANNQRLFETAKKAKAKTNLIEEIDVEKEETLAAAKFPVPELSFDESGVIYRGFPFGQASGAEQLRVSMGVAIALNPSLKVCLIRDGSLLDQSNLALVAEMAEQHGAQVWLERVSDGPEVQVLIEDGMVKETREPKSKKAPAEAVAA